jgi:hypothetical protein
MVDSRHADGSRHTPLWLNWDISALPSAEPTILTIY